MVATLSFSIIWNFFAAKDGKYLFSTTGKVVEIIPQTPEDKDRVPSNGGFAVVEYKDPNGNLKADKYTMFNSGGATMYFGKNVGDTVNMQLTFDEAVPGSVKFHRWEDLGWVLIIFGAGFSAMGVILKYF